MVGKKGKEELILLVEDEKGMRESLKILFANEGYQIITAQDGREAIEILEKKTIPLVITDLVTPNINGFGVMEYLQKNSPETLVIAITGYASMESAIEALRRGAYDYIVKPFDFELLKITVEKAWEKIRLRKEIKRAEERIFQAEKFASLGELISRVAHELNNKLTPILAYSQFLKNSSLKGKELKSLNLIIQSALGAKNVADSLLGLSRKEEPQKQYTNLNKVMKKALSLLDYYFQSENIKVIADLNPTLPHTVADPSQMEQVFINLLNNAAQAIEGKGGKIWVTSYQEKDQIIFKISDNGEGIPEEHLPKIFDPFFTTKEKGKGTGLGLSLCQKIMEVHKGEIQVKSAPGLTTFTLQLPLLKKVEKERKAVSKTLVKLPPREGGVKRKMLIVDDEDSIVQLISDLLEERFEVFRAKDGKEAAVKIEQTDFDLIITDIKMPRLDGINLYRWVKESRPELSSRMIFTTGNTYDSRTKNFLEETNSCYIAKPFDLDELLRLIRE